MVFLIDKITNYCLQSHVLAINLEHINMHEVYSIFSQHQLHLGAKLKGLFHQLCPSVNNVNSQYLNILPKCTFA